MQFECIVHPIYITDRKTQSRFQKKLNLFDADEIFFKSYKGQNKNVFWQH